MKNKKFTDLLNKKGSFKKSEINQKLQKEKIDVTLPGRTFFWKNTSSFTSY